MARLAEINKTLKEQTAAIEYGNRGTDDLRMKFGAFVDGIKSGAGDQREKEIEASRAARAAGGRARPAGPRGIARGFGAGIGGLLGGLGGFGKVAAGLGIAGLLAMQFVDGEKIKTNVETLLSIGERYKENTVSQIFEDGAVILALKGLGVGMLVFSAGAAASVGVDALDKATMEKFESSTGWAENVKNNIVTLLSVKDKLGGTNKAFIGDAATFPVAMLGLSTGLGIFAVGQALSVAGEAFKKWAGADDWAVNIKENVMTLLSISRLEGLGYDVKAFTGTMLKISGALLGFGVAAAGSKALSGLADWMGEGKDWAKATADKVKTLLSLVKDGPAIQKAQDFKDAMESISDGLKTFAGASFTAGIKNAVAAILEFFTGKNAFSHIMKIAEEADDLDKGAKAVDSLTVSLEKLGNLKFRGDSIKMKEFALDLANSVEIIETALEGGTFKAGFLPKFLTGKTIKGLNSPDIDYANAVKNITALKAALRIGVGPGDVLDRYGNTFQFPTSLERIEAFGSGSGLSEFMMKPAADGRGKKRIRRGFEENELDALAADGFKLRNPIQYIDNSSSQVNNNNSSQTNTIITGSTTDESLRLN